LKEKIDENYYLKHEINSARDFSYNNINQVKNILKELATKNRKVIK
jgi:hypothetical protein